MKIQAFCICEDPRRASGEQGIALLETCSAGACLKLGVAPLWQVDVEGSCLRGRGRKSRRRARVGTCPPAAFATGLGPTGASQFVGPLPQCILDTLNAHRDIFARAHRPNDSRNSVSSSILSNRRDAHRQKKTMKILRFKTRVVNSCSSFARIALPT